MLINDLLGGNGDVGAGLHPGFRRGRVDRRLLHRRLLHLQREEDDGRRVQDDAARALHEVRRRPHQGHVAHLHAHVHAQHARRLAQSHSHAVTES